MAATAGGPSPFARHVALNDSPEHLLVGFATREPDRILAIHGPLMRQRSMGSRASGPVPSGRRGQ